jgi:hypothetical protein
MKRRQFSSLAGGAALASIDVSPAFAHLADGCALPTARGDGWSVSASNDDKLIDEVALCKMADQLALSSNIHSVLVARSGKLVFGSFGLLSD